MSSPSKRRQSAVVSLTREKSQDPLPADPQGQRLCEIFGRYLWCSIYADAPIDNTQKAKWYTQRRYPLKGRVLWREWQDTARLVGVRPGHDTVYALIDIDTNSPYHPNQDGDAIARMQAALETIGIVRTLVIQSSWSGGIHLYIPLPLAVKTFDLAVSLQNCLEAQEFRLRPGELELFPNVKTYGTAQKIEYRAHRLPLQPGSGSCLLDSELNPGSSQLSDFLAQWDIAAAGQDIATLQSALPIARKNRRKKVRKRLNKAEAWKADLETVLAEGWTGSGQTNQLLKEFGCYGVVFLELSGEDLVDYIQQQAISSPGYQKWCRHQREIGMRSRVWAASVEKYYWPLGSYSDIRKTAKNDIVPFNELRAQQAQASIRDAVRQLEATDQLPGQATARARAIRRVQAEAGTSSSMETLYRPENKKLWHPGYYESNQEKTPVIPAPVELIGNELGERESKSKTLKLIKDGELRTKAELMKCEDYKSEVSASAQTKFDSERGVRGERESFPQAALTCGSNFVTDEAPYQTSTRKTFPAPQQIKKKIPKTLISGSKDSSLFEPEGISEEVYETIVAIQNTIWRLNWAPDQTSDFIADRFQGKRRAHLRDDELVELLYYLRVHCSEDS